MANINAEMVSTIVMVLIAYNILGSMVVKALYYIKDKTETKADNYIWGILKAGVDKTKESLDYLMGNIRH